MSIQTTNTTNGLGYGTPFSSHSLAAHVLQGTLAAQYTALNGTITSGTQPTRYVLSPAQQNFLKKLRDWLMNSNSQHLPSDPLQVMEYTSLLVRTLKRDGYDEEDRFIINHIRYLYLKDKDTLPF